MGRSAVRAGVPEEPEPGKGIHTERQAGAEEHDKLILRSAHRLDF